MNIKELVKPNIRSLRAYHAEDLPCRAKLDANESPYPALSSQQSAVSVKNALQSLNRYPDPQAISLRKLLATGLKVKPQNILHGNGSDELIQSLIATFGGPVLYPVPTFSMYGIIAQSLGERRGAVPLDEKFDLDIDKFLDAIKKRNPKLIFLSSPNNPTGNSFSYDRILKIIKRSNGIVVVDEAYQPFSSKKSFIPMLKKHKNLVILRTMSKTGLAALRVGFMITHEDIVNEVNKVRLPFNLNSLSQKLAAAALSDEKPILANVKGIISERKRLMREMKKIKGIIPYPSDANFILFKVEDSDIIHRMLLKKGVLVRNMRGVVDGCLRVTAGTPGENSEFLRMLKQLMTK
ncbi:MAG: histidinol-phosphate transaminase [Nitrospirae bacterium]|nr:histidinol-phosphate transaminase [Nitrospirota bacterium]